MFTNTYLMNTIFTITVIIMMLTSIKDVHAEDTISVRLGVYTDHPFSDGYSTLERGNYQYKGEQYNYRYVENKDYNEDNNLIALEYKNTLVATFKNSYEDRTYFVAYKALDIQFLRTSYGDFSLKGYMGVTHGYVKGETMKDNMCVSDKVCYSSTIGIEYQYKSYSVDTTVFGTAINVSVGKEFDLK